MTSGICIKKAVPLFPGLSTGLKPHMTKQISLDSKLDYNLQNFLPSMCSTPNLGIYLEDFCVESNPLKNSRSRSPISIIASSNTRAPAGSHEAPARLYSPPRIVASAGTRGRAHSIDSGSNVKTFCFLDTNRVDFMDNDLPTLVSKTDAGLKGGVEPILAEGAMGGSYFLRDKSRAIQLVFKPSDEEPHAPNNPHQHSGTYGIAYKGRIVPGFGMYREFAAYVLDLGGFVGVPPTGTSSVLTQY